MPASVDITTPSDREIAVTRAFDAPAQLVFDYHTKPELVQKWLLGPPGWTMPVCKIDLRVGGRYQYVWHSESRGVEFGVRGEYREITAPKRIVNVEQMDGREGEALVSQTFVPNGDRTTLTTVIRLASKEARDEALESGMTDGMSESFDRLQDIIDKEHDEEQRR
jgi:uncharacterized protein YndB with AHSA1/START domain